MKAAPFDYCRPSSVPDAVRALAESQGNGKILAGGQSLVPVLAMRLGRPGLLVDVNRIPGLDTITRENGCVRIGALVRHRDLMAQALSPMLAEAASWIGHSAIRSRGTAGGSIAHADPAAELPVVATAVGASVHVTGAAGSRVVGVEDLFVGPLETSLREDEMVVSIDFPVPQRWGFAELARRHGDFGLVTVAVAEIADAIRIAIGGVGSVAVRPREAESILADGHLGADRLRDAARAAAESIVTIDDVHATARYRSAMVEEMSYRALTQAVASRGREKLHEG